MSRYPGPWSVDQVSRGSWMDPTYRTACFAANNKEVPLSEVVARVKFLEKALEQILPHLEFDQPDAPGEMRMIQTKYSPNRAQLEWDVDAPELTQVLEEFLRSTAQEDGAV